jgi:hypothetical protein
MPAGQEIHGCDLTQPVEQPGRAIASSCPGRPPRLLVQLRLDNAAEVSPRALGIVPVDVAERFSTEAPAHHLPEHSRSRPVEFGRQLLTRGTSPSIQAGIHTEAGARLAQPVIRWSYRTPPWALIHKRGSPNP